MPTGYTAPIHDGEDISFEDFTLLCSRAMGARVMERDDPLKPAVPSPNVPSQFYRESLYEAMGKLDNLRKMDVGEAQRMADQKHQRDLDYYNESTVNRNEMTQRYQAMMDKVNAWEPPTPDHSGLKAFMLKQLEESIQFDCSPGYPTMPTEQSGEAWLSEELKHAERSVERYREEWTKELGRTEGRNQWMVDLLTSLHIDVPEGFRV